MIIFFVVIVLGLEIYSDKLIKEGIVSPEDVKSVRDKYEKICDEALELSKKETHIKVRNVNVGFRCCCNNVVFALANFSSRIGWILHGLVSSKEKIH